MFCNIGPLLVHAVAAITMMSFSSYYHLFLCENAERGNLLRCFDFVGICVMICGSTTAPFYYGFQCEASQFWGSFYLLQVWSLCLIAMFLTLYYKDDPSKKMLNAISYIVAGYSTVPGIIHLAYYTEDELVRHFAVWPWLVGGIFYAVGAIIYALFIPDRFFPNSTFMSTWFQSHTIFHWMILAAAIVHFWASVRVFHER